MKPHSPRFPCCSRRHGRPGRARPTSAAIRPVGGQRGTEVEVNLTGARLGDAQEILFYQPGIARPSSKAVDDNHVKAKLKIAAGLPARAA